MTAKRPIYIVDIDQPGERIPGSGPCRVYGDEDLKRRQDAATEAGVKLTVRPAPKD